MARDLLVGLRANSAMLNDRPLTAAEKLVVKTWPVFVSRSQVLDPDWAEFIGVPGGTSGTENVAMHGGINTYLSTAKLAEIYAIGGRPHFREVKNTVEIYKDLTSYLIDFSRLYRNNHFNTNVSDKMADNILKLENFAEWISHIAKQHMTRDDLLPENSLINRIGRGRFTRDMFEKKPVTNPGVVLTHENAVLPAEATTHVRVTDSVMEEHFEKKAAQARQKSTRNSGWG